MSQMEGFSHGFDWSEQWKTLKFDESDDEDDFDCKFEEEQCRTLVIRDYYDDDDGDDDDSSDNDDCADDETMFMLYPDGAISNRIRSTTEFRAIDEKQSTRKGVKVYETKVLGRNASENKRCRFSEGNTMSNPTGILNCSQDMEQKLKRNKSWPEYDRKKEREQPKQPKQPKHQHRSKSFQVHSNNVVAESSSNGSLKCGVCFSDEVPLLSRDCCPFPVCQTCFKQYLTTKIDEGAVPVTCISYECRKDVAQSEIFETVDSETAQKFSRILAEKKRSKSVQTCPKCNTITVVSEKILERTSSSKPDLFIICPVCDQVWTYSSPIAEHVDKISKLKDDAKFERWTRRVTNDQRNARQCPKCKIFIQKNGGCDKIACTRCTTSFCYVCGRRYRNGKHICVNIDVLSRRSVFMNPLRRLVNLIKSKRE